MKKFLINASLILLVFSLAYFGNHSVQSYLGQQAKQSIPFNINQLQPGLEQAAEQNRLVIADYSAIWCPSCRKLDTEVFSDPGVASTISDNFTFVKVDHDSDVGKQFAQTHQLVGFPRVLILNQNGEKLTELPLSFDPQQYNANLRQVLMAYQVNEG